MYRIVIKYAGSQNANRIDEIDPFNTMKQVDDKLIIDNGYHMYYYDMDKVIDIKFEKVD